MNLKRSAAAILFFIFAGSAWAIEIRINDSRENNFYLEALIWVLDKSGEPYTLVTTDYPISSQARKIAFVKNGNIDVIYAGTSADLEKKLAPIRFPVMRGLAGRRIFIIHRAHQAAFDRVKDLDDLKRHTGVQGLGWGDRQVLEASGLKQTSKLYDDIFMDINAGAPYYFPRGVTEVFAELETKRLPNLTAEKHILLVYKTAVFFFVNPSNSRLAAVLNQGFSNAYADGSYNRFFYNHPRIKRSLARADLTRRTIIEIPNPYLSPETRAIPDKYWH